MTEKIPRLLIAGLAGDSGKTVVSLSLVTALRDRLDKLAVFKKGPDYIDAAWLSFFADSQCRNLDTYMIEPTDVLSSFGIHATGADMAIIEGNRGIFDGQNVSGTHSTAGLAKLLQAPVLLVIDCTKSTRTIAAILRGCMEFDPAVNIAGVILNKIAGKRHRKIITESIARYCDIPVLGVIPKLTEYKQIIPSRHLGLVTPSEYKSKSELQELLLKVGSEYLDIDAIIELGKSSSSIAFDNKLPERKQTAVKVGYFNDELFTFYYPENLEQLASYGAELVKISSLYDDKLPAIDALYIGGGFPESKAEKLAANTGLLDSVREAAVKGLPIYAECGGLVYLSRSLKSSGAVYPMAGVFPIDLVMNKKPVGHGYTSVTIDRQNPYFEIGTAINGHEFHYSGLTDLQTVEAVEMLDCCMAVHRGFGLTGNRDGLVYNNVLATYTHLHAAGIKRWASSFVGKAFEYKHNNEPFQSAQMQANPCVQPG